MTTPYRPFDVTTLALRGLQLVEASAGTGKTASLAGLYTRLVIAEGAAPRDILVMTFTRAATQELRERIRTRLAAAARIAADPACARPDDHGDRLSAALIDAAVRALPGARDALARRLREAAARIDEATITTIHGFSQRAAAEHAFDSGVAFDRGEQADDGALHAEATRDYWRSRVLGAPEGDGGFRALWPTPDALWAILEPILGKPHATLAGPDGAEIEATLEAARAGWARDGERLASLLGELVACGAFQATSELGPVLRARGPGALMHELATGLGAERPILPAWIERLDPDLMRRKELRKAAQPAWFDAWAQSAYAAGAPGAAPLPERLLAGRRAARHRELRCAVAAIRARTIERKRARRLFSFDDMIAALHEALTTGPHADALADALHRRWPFALVDEFQDTDPLQYEILRRIHADRDRGALLLIGDPKQAIYAFRGGDVHAYLRAAAAAGTRHTLDTNHRSTPGLVEAVGRLFGAGGEAPFLVEGIDLAAVRAGRPAGDRRLVEAGRELAALTLWPLPDDEASDEPEPSGPQGAEARPAAPAASPPEDRALPAERAGAPTGADAGSAEPEVPARRAERQTSRARGGASPPRDKGGATLTKEQARPRLAAAAVARIVALLDPRHGARLEGEDGRSRALLPGDIGVLVDTNEEASTMQALLARRGVPAVCVHRASVFASPEAEDLERVLRALAAPADEDRVRAALATTLLGYRLGPLAALAGDEPGWQAVLDRFQAAHERWRAAGVLPALRPFLQDAAPRLLALEDGERRATNYLQLAELLQGADAEAFGPAGLLRWLAEARRHPRTDETAEAEQLRLESDEALVRITTVHRAKGLQYPVVVLPFAPWLGATGQPDRAPYVFHDDAGATRIDVDHDPGGKSARRAIRERRAEAVRLLYVALTRAEQACFLPWGVANGTADAALATVLHRDDGIDPQIWYGSRGAGPLAGAAVRARLEALTGAGGEPGDIAPPPIALEPLPALAPGARYHPIRAPRAWVGARTDLPAPRRPWAVLSYSRLVGPEDPGRRDGAERPPASGAEDEIRDDPEEALGPQRLRGPAFGTAVHALLEENLAIWPPPGSPIEPGLLARVAGALRDHGIDPARTGDPATAVARTAELVRACVHTPLPAIGPLAAVPAGRQRRELEFALGLDGGPAGALGERLAAAGYAGALPGEQRARVLRGLLHGYIDLVVEAGGRYFVLDYKTNDLGPRRADYAPPALAAAVRRGHYDLQYLLYTVALHRHLARRLPGYCVHRHLGGVRYLFVRGMDGVSADHGVFTDHPDPDLVLALDGLLGGASAAPARTG